MTDIDPIAAFRLDDMVVLITGALVEDLPDALAVEVDLTTPGAVDFLVRAATDRYGRIDVLVNNAGVSTAVPALEFTADDFRRPLEIDLVVSDRDGSRAVRRRPCRRLHRRQHPHGPNRRASRTRRSAAVPGRFGIELRHRADNPRRRRLDHNLTPPGPCQPGVSRGGAGAHLLPQVGVHQRPTARDCEVPDRSHSIKRSAKGDTCCATPTRRVKGDPRWGSSERLTKERQLEQK